MLEITRDAPRRGGRSLLTHPSEREVRQALGAGAGAGVPFLLGAMATLGSARSWQLVTGAFAAWRADLGMAYSPGASMTWTDQVGGSTLAQSTGTLVPTWSASDADLGGQAAIVCDGSDDVLVSNLAAASWNFLHDGTGAALLLVCRPTKTTGATNIVAHTTTGSGGRGVRMLHSATNNRMRWSVSDGASFVIDINTGAGATEPVNLSVLATHETAATPDAELRHPPGTTIGSGSGTPSASAASTTLTVGGFTSNQFGGDIAELVVWNRNLTAGEITTLAAYTLARYGV